MPNDTLGSLATLVDRHAARDPVKIAAAIPGGARVTYRELAGMSDRLRDRLWHLGVRPGDRVGILLPKSIDALAAIFGILKTGAAYVPVDAASPAERAAFILRDCQVKAVITDRERSTIAAAQTDGGGAAPAILAVNPDLPTLLDSLQATDPAAEVPSIEADHEAIAYILYTSGSTGKPKGVVLSHRNATSFVAWCAATFEPVPGDTFASHAPFHFDLSILDIFVSLGHGATVLLIDDGLGKDPERLASVISSERISVWYSTPSILSLLANYGRLDRYDYTRLRLVLFAGEVFPMQQLRRLRALWRHPRSFNLYGPTETNVCTFYEVPGDDELAAMDTLPIGQMCAPNLGMVVDERGERVADGSAGELVVSGPHVMKGYWNLADENQHAFLVDGQSTHWYRTGDIVTEDTTGQYRYLGRRDRMVKRRGYRVELGEIEAALARQPDVREVAVVAVSDSVSGVHIVAFVSGPDGKGLNTAALKKASLLTLPSYMLPDSFVVLDALPRTSTNKVDFKALESRVKHRDAR